ncbi:uncharacterized protein RAG0_16142 [Rhynchosporium agropyri]|uniref:Uncharacterized protein n=1 Tax=Rhynchosporium agropyri TaxID=914238 RepID=A0A1E1LP69_9HELO|nr:uncharacterized protein RAG0_16142 [Rhynchosporium agropyri]
MDEVLDKVIQDDDDTEAAAQFLRVASGNRPQRLKVAEKLSLAKPPKFRLEDEDEGNVI